MFEFILERYNYWIVITLMMTGLYIVFSRGNLVKTLIGLNLFQTSVFIFYITIGKINGGTAPILPEKKYDDHGHGGDYADKAHGAADAKPHDDLKHEAGNDLSEAVKETDHLQETGDTLHSLPEGVDATNNSLAVTTGSAEMAEKTDNLHLDPQTGHDAAEAATGYADKAADYAAETAGYAAEVVYTNPLPHVLILTAIVVGVATTAVGLALAVRIREAYGTIEEDELEAADHLAEFGTPIEQGLSPSQQAGGAS
jgi:multicomponent Na+:H+ antiporter subunit C